jgi:hypothetical protein
MSRRKSTAASTSPYRSKLEGKVAALLPNVRYEQTKLKYTVPASKHTYTVDFELGPNSFIEVKGYLKASERKKYLLVRECNPEIKLRFFFDKADNRIYKGSPTTYAMWCEQNGFDWTDLKRGLPPEWLEDLP